MDNQQNKPQDNQKVEAVSLNEVKDMYAESRGFANWKSFINEFSINEKISDLISVGYSNLQAAPLQSRIAELEKQNAVYREAFEKIKDYQMDHVEIARATKVYQIAEQALKDNG